jgi:hypothetical protein
MRIHVHNESEITAEAVEVLTERLSASKVARLLSSTLACRTRRT